MLTTVLPLLLAGYAVAPRGCAKRQGLPAGTPRAAQRDTRSSQLAPRAGWGRTKPTPSHHPPKQCLMRKRPVLEAAAARPTDAAATLT